MLSRFVVAGPQPGQAPEMSQAVALIGGSPAEVVIADKGYDSRAVVEAIEVRGAEAVIPGPRNRARRRGYDRGRDQNRDPAGRSCSRAEPKRRVATRDESTARELLASIHVAPSPIPRR